MPPPEQIQAGIIDQYSQLGIFVLILAAMGSSPEKWSKAGQLLSTLDVTGHRYVLTKWMMLAALTVFSILIGLSHHTIGDLVRQSKLGACNPGRTGLFALSPICSLPDATVRYVKHTSCLLRLDFGDRHRIQLSRYNGQLLHGCRTRRAPSPRT